jgi:hypothetical protein
MKSLIKGSLSDMGIDLVQKNTKPPITTLSDSEPDDNTTQTAE